MQTDQQFDVAGRDRAIVGDFPAAHFSVSDGELRPLGLELIFRFLLVADAPLDRFVQTGVEIESGGAVYLAATRKLLNFGTSSETAMINCDARIMTETGTSILSSISNRALRIRPVISSQEAGQQRAPPGASIKYSIDQRDEKSECSMGHTLILRNLGGPPIIRRSRL